MKSKILIVTILLLALVFIAIFINQSSKKSYQPVNPPIPEAGEVDFCKEGIRGNDCIKCSCKSADDCKLVVNPYVISECAKPEAVSKSTSKSCINKVRKTAIRANCVVPENYSPPEYEVVCINNICGKVKK